MGRDGEEWGGMRRDEELKNRGLMGRDREGWGGMINLTYSFRKILILWQISADS